MNRKELVGRVAEKTGLYHKAVDHIVGSLVDEIQEQLARGDSVKIQGLGTFEVRPRAPRKGRNLVNGESVEVPARLVPGFKPSRLLRELVDQS